MGYCAARIIMPDSIRPIIHILSMDCDVTYLRFLTSSYQPPLGPGPSLGFLYILSTSFILRNLFSIFDKTSSLTKNRFTPRLSAYTSEYPLYLPKLYSAVIL